MPEQQKFLIINTPLVHQGSRIDEQRCEFPLPLKVSRQSENKKLKVDSVYECDPMCVHLNIYFPNKKKKAPNLLYQILVSVLVSAFNDRWRAAAHPAIESGGLLDRPPAGEDCRCESHLFPLWLWSREL